MIVCFYIYCLAIKPYILKLGIKDVDNPIFNYVNNLANILIDSNEKVLSKGIWNLFNEYKLPSLDLTHTNNYYKKFNNVLQPINFF